VVVDERGAVQKFDYGREADGTGAGVSSITRAEQEERGAKPLASTTQEGASYFGNRFEGGGALTCQLVFDKNEIVAGEIKDFPGCEKRDGLSSYPALAVKRLRVNRVVSRFACAAVKHRYAGLQRTWIFQQRFLTRGLLSRLRLSRSPVKSPCPTERSGEN